MNGSLLEDELSEQVHGDQYMGSEEVVVMYFSKMRRPILEEEGQTEADVLGLEW